MILHLRFHSPYLSDEKGHHDELGNAKGTFRNQIYLGFRDSL